MHETRASLVAVGGAGPAALVLGLDSHGLAIARALSDTGIVTYAAEQDLTLPGVRSNRVNRVFPVRSFNEADLIPALIGIREELSHHSQVALLAVNDRQVSLIARHRSVLVPAFSVVWADKADTVLTLQLKSELEDYSRSRSMEYPKSFVFEGNVGALPDHGLRFPVIIKPVRPLSSFKTLIASDDQELITYLRRHAQDLPILAQEYIPGDDSCLYFGALMLHEGRVLQSIAGRKIASHPPARGQTTIAETVHEPEVIRLTERFFDGLALSGPVSLELKRDDLGRYWVIEPTVGRTDFWAELCISAGFNQPALEFMLACGLYAAHPQRANSDCVWYDTERDPLAFFRQCCREKSFRPRRKPAVFPYFGHGDMGPFWRALRRLTAFRLRRVGIGGAAGAAHFTTKVGSKRSPEP